jgi:acyl carrier protein
MIVACEDEFKIEIDMDHPDTRNAKTVRDLYNGILVLTGSN